MSVCKIWDRGRWVFMPGSWGELMARGFPRDIIERVTAWWRRRDEIDNPLPDGFRFSWELLEKIARGVR